MLNHLVDVSNIGSIPQQVVRNGVINRGALYRSLVENGVLREDDTRQIDEAVVKVSRRDLIAIARLRAAGLIKPLNDIGITSHEYDRITPVGPATQSMSILDIGQNDLVTFGRTAIPVPVTASTFRMDARMRAAGSRRGEGIDTTNIEEHTRAVAEKMEDTLVNGSTIVLGQNGLPGYTNFGARHQLSFSNGAWGTSGWTPADGVFDVLAALTALRNDGFTGPFDLNLPQNYSGLLDDDYKANSDRTFRERLLAIDGIQSVQILPSLADDNIIIVQMTSSVVQWADAQDITPITWDLMGGLAQKWAIINVGAPLLKSSYARGALSLGDLPALTTSAGIAHIAG